MINRLPYLIISLLFCMSSMAQTQRAYIEAAKNSAKDSDYYSALQYYQNAYEFDSTNITIAYAIAENSRKFNAYSIAEKFYSKTMELDNDNLYPLAGFYLANMQQRQGKYSAAESSYQSYLTEYEDIDLYYTNRTQKELEAVLWAKEINNSPRQDIIVTKLGGDINTEKSDFAPYLLEDEFYYSSLRFEEDNPKSISRKNISKILKTSNFEVSSELESIWNQSGKFTAHTTFNADQSVMYFTICEYIEGAKIRCDIYKSMRDGGSFGEAIKLPENINNPFATNTQPSFGLDISTGQELLFFASDRDGGKGKIDIYVSILSDGEYSDPVNLDVINTSENDITPFYHGASQMLYFSSEGHKGLGGFDIFKIRYQQGNFGDGAIHLGTPINSSYNDVYYWRSEKDNLAYFSSNNIESSYVDDVLKACCYDIYKTEYTDLDIILNALTFNKRSLDELTSTVVILQDKFTGEEIDRVVSSNSDNGHIFKLQSDREYMIIGEKTGYTSDTIQLSTLGVYIADTITKKLFLDPTEVELEVLVFDAETLENLNGATVTLIDLSDTNADDVVLTIDNSNMFSFRLQPGRIYKVLISRNGYESQSFEVNTDSDFPQGKLSQKVFLRKKDLNVFLPAFLYFDNDRPNPKSLAESTNLMYSETYHPYIARKNYFVQRTGASLSEELRVLERQRMADFFEFEVKGGFIKLNMFLKELEKKLEEGYEFEILIKGFASPLASNSYNKALSKRRISSVINELSKYAGGILLRYMKEGKLLVTDVSFGEDLAPESVSDSRRRLSASIFSVEASKERRIEIIKVRNSFYQNDDLNK